METREIDIMARTIYGEARGEYYHREGGVASLIAVGNVIMNRLHAKDRYGSTVKEVCLKPWQFSCWNNNDPNRNRLLDDQINDSVFPICRHISEKVFQGHWPDLTRGSNHYHTTTMPVIPKWAKDREPALRLAGHVFYRLNKEK
jgi:N-acetylmuramoyl-L-alanine amidase